LLAPYPGRGKSPIVIVMTADESLGTYFDALYQITLRTSSSLDLDDVLAYLTEETADAVGARAASVRLLDASGEVL